MERFTAKLYMSSVTVYDDRLEIKKGVFAKDITTLPLNTITAVTSKKPGMSRGYINFATAAGGVTVEYGPIHERAAATLKSTVESIMMINMNKEGVGATINVTQQVGATEKTGAEKIRELKSLFDDGVISEEEFNEAKRKALGL